MRIDKDDYRLEVIKNYVEYKIGINDISLPTKTNPYVFSRATFYYLCREYTGYSMESIGEYVGRDHACVIHALKKTLKDVPEKYNEAIRDFNKNSLLTEEVGYSVIRDNESLVLNNRDLEKRNSRLRRKLSTMLNEGVVGRLAGLLVGMDEIDKRNISDRIEAMIMMENKKKQYKSLERKQLNT